MFKNMFEKSSKNRRKVDNGLFLIKKVNKDAEADYILTPPMLHTSDFERSDIYCHYKSNN